jgi:hypothetical protein
MLGSTKGRVKVQSLKEMLNVQAKQPQIIASLVPAPQPQPAPVPAQSPAPVCKPAPVAVVAVQKVSAPIIHQTINHTHVVAQDTKSIEDSKQKALAAQKKAEECLLAAQEERKISEEAVRVAKESEQRIKETELKNASEMENLKTQLAFINIEFNALKNKNSIQSPSSHHPMVESDGLALLFSDNKLPPSSSSSSTPDKSISPGNSQQASPKVGKGKNEWENVDISDGVSEPGSSVNKPIV